MDTNKPYEYFTKFQESGKTRYTLRVAVQVAAGNGIGTYSKETRTVGDHLETFITLPIISDSSTEQRVIETVMVLDPQANETDLQIETQLANGETAGTNKKRYSQATADDE